MFSPPNHRYTTGNLTLFQPEEGGRFYQRSQAKKCGYISATYPYVDMSNQTLRIDKKYHIQIDILVIRNDTNAYFETDLLIGK